MPLRNMDANGSYKSKSQVPVDDSDLEDVRASFEKDLKKAKESIEKAEIMALQINDALKSSNLSAKDAHQSSTPLIHPAAIKVEKSPIDEEEYTEGEIEMLKILFPKLFEKPSN